MNQMVTNPAKSITKAASSQTYYTIRFLADRERNEDAYRAYAYFRWVDDVLDASLDSGAVPSESETSQRTAFLERQKSLLEKCYSNETVEVSCAEEQILVDLTRGDEGKCSGLQSYLRNMMLVMDFDTKRRGRLLSNFELGEYTRWLAVAVTEAIHHFIGHGTFAPRDECRYLAVSAAHIAHMLRDTYDDVQAGYFNVPREVLEANQIGLEDVHHPAYRVWVKSRVDLAREYFKAGTAYFSEVENLRCRMACFAYIARFDWLLDTLEREDYYLRPRYDERKQLKTGLRMGWHALSSAVLLREPGDLYRPVPAQKAGKP